MEFVNSGTRLLFATSHLFPATIGGSGMDVFWLGKGLTKAGFQVETVTTDWGIPDGVLAKNQWIDTECGRANYTTRIHDLLPTKMTWAGLERVKSVDIVQLNGLWHPTSPLLARKALRYKKPVIWSVHGGLDASAMRFSALRKKWMLAYIKRSLANHVLFRSTCERETECIRAAFGRQTRVIEIPVFVYFNTLVQRSEPQAPYFLFIGRLHPIKGIDRLIRGMTLSTKFMLSKMRLVIAGNNDNEYGQELKKLAVELGVRDRIDFVGQVEGEAKDRLIANARWAFLPSMTENMGVVVLECMAQGTPYTASTGTPWKVLVEKNLGYWISNRPEAIAENIDQILSLSSDLYADIRERCISFARKEYGIDQRIDTWIECYKSLAS